MTIELGIDERVVHRPPSSPAPRPSAPRPAAPPPAGLSPEREPGRPGVVGVRPVPRSTPQPLSWGAWQEAAPPHPELPGLSLLAGPEDRQAVPAIEVATTPALPDAAEWSSWLAQLVIEVLHGRRPVNQLSRWTEERVLATVVLRARQIRTGGNRGRTPAPLRVTAALGTVRIQQPTGHAVEASAVIRGARVSALAFRLEARGDRWLCTEIDFGPQTPQPS